MQMQSIKPICAHYVTAVTTTVMSNFSFPVSCCRFRTAPVPKYLKMHYVKEEIGDGKGVCVNVDSIKKLNVKKCTLKSLDTYY